MPRRRILSADLNNLIQPFANLHEQGIGQRAHRMRLGLAQAPIERLGLVTKHVAGLPGLAARCLPYCNRKRIIRIVFRAGHRQPDNE